MRHLFSSQSNRIASIGVVAGLALGTCVIVAPNFAFAGKVVFVSNSGTDAGGCGDPDNPCKTLGFALSTALTPGGTIHILDDTIVSGAVTIPASASIIGNGRLTIRQSSANFGLRIAAGATGRVVLKGITIDGGNSGTIGLDVLHAASLTVLDCLVENFVGDGIRIESNVALKYDITNTTVVDNGAHGIYVAPRSGGSAVGSIVNSEVHRNRGGYGGIAVDGSYGGAPATAHIQNTRSNFNTGVGFAKVTDGSFYLANSTATGNSNNIASAGGGGPGYSYQNNFLRGNTSDSGTGYLTNVLPQ